MKSGSISRLAAKVAIFGVVVLAAGSMALACSSGDDDSATSTPTVAASTTTTPTGGTGASNTPTASTTAGATGASGSTGASADVEDFIHGFIDSYNNGDATAFFGKMTDEALTGYLSFQGIDTSDLEAAKQEAAPFIGEDPIELQNVNVTDTSNDSASAEIQVISFGVYEGDHVELTKQDGEWKVSALDLYAVSPDVPDGYTTYDMTLDEFAFGLDSDVKSGKDAFALKNIGQQPHEAILAKLDPGVDLMQALQSPDQPEGVEVIGGASNIQPGDSYNLVFTEPLEPGRYAFVCFMPDLTEGANGTPHAFQGMVKEFTIQ